MSEEKPKRFKGRGFLIGIILILIIRLVSSLGTSLENNQKTDKREDTSYQEEQQDLSDQEFAYADREELKRKQETDNKKDNESDKKESSDTDARGRSKGGSSKNSSASKFYRITMPGEGSKQEASYDWRYVNNMMKKRDYSLTLELLNKTVKEEEAVLDYLDHASLQDLGVDPDLRYVSEIKYQLSMWKAAYREMYLKSKQTFNPLIAGFKEVFEKEGFTTREKLDFLVTFVQNIRYERPGGELDVFPPLVTLSRRFGDCDTKSLLLYVLLEKFGYDCVMMWSQHYKHAMLGIYDGGSGDYKSWDGKKYYFVETTYPGWAIGQLPPKWDNTSYWYTIKL